MSMCSICLEGYKRPVSLPCGHVFCTECLARTVQTVQPARNFHSCPTCRTAYSIVPVNSSAIPPHLRPFLSAGIRRVYLDGDASVTESNGTEHPSSPTSASHESSDELDRLRAENQTLRSHCVLWRRRAELHGAATLGLLDFARMVRDQATTLARERDELKRQYGSLKRKLEESNGPSSQQASPIEPPRLPSFEFAFPPEAFGRTVEESRLSASAMFNWNSCVPSPASGSTASSSSQLSSASQRHRPSSSSISASGSVPSLDSRLLERPMKRLRRGTYPPQGVLPALHVPESPRHRT
ncbi:hypothetical protein BKA70DRAFT_469402 [Coprinopsis sp. MPI-PUGE-AT-0042]|nr:hypothetical protein BKA70DRAFT_469402 [Coprinopsis sp. MPI-PUGE-AT-0042]